MPALIAPSPITAIALPGLPPSLLATAKPSAAEIEVEECAAPNGSYSLSLRLVKPLRPPPWRKRADALAPPGDDLVRIGLVADIPHQPIVGRVEHVMQRDGQLDHAEPRAEVAAGAADRLDHLGAQLVRQLAQLAGSSLRCRRGISTVSSSGVSGPDVMSAAYTRLAGVSMNGAVRFA